MIRLYSGADPAIPSYEADLAMRAVRILRALVATLPSCAFCGSPAMRSCDDHVNALREVAPECKCAAALREAVALLAEVGTP